MGYNQRNKSSKTTLTKINNSPSEFITDFSGMIKNLLIHDFICKKQSSFSKNLTENLPDNEVKVQIDFAENYAFIVQNAVQAFHWNNNQATIYNVYITGKINNEVAHRSLVIVSDSLNHDAVAVFTFNKIITDFINPLRMNSPHSDHKF